MKPPQADDSKRQHDAAPAKAGDKDRASKTEKPRPAFSPALLAAAARSGNDVAGSVTSAATATPLGSARAAETARAGPPHDAGQTAPPVKSPRDANEMDSGSNDKPGKGGGGKGGGGKGGGSRKGGGGKGGGGKGGGGRGAGSKGDPQGGGETLGNGAIATNAAVQAALFAKVSASIAAATPPPNSDASSGGPMPLGLRPAGKGESKAAPPPKASSGALAAMGRARLAAEPAQQVTSAPPAPTSQSSQPAQPSQPAQREKQLDGASPRVSAGALAAMQRAANAQVAETTASAPPGLLARPGGSQASNGEKANDPVPAPMANGGGLSKDEAAMIARALREAEAKEKAKEIAAERQAKRNARAAKEAAEKAEKAAAAKAKAAKEEEKARAAAEAKAAQEAEEARAAAALKAKEEREQAAAARQRKLQSQMGRAGTMFAALSMADDDVLDSDDDIDSGDDVDDDDDDALSRAQAQAQAEVEAAEAAAKAAAIKAAALAAEAEAAARAAQVLASQKRSGAGATGAAAAALAAASAPDTIDSAPVWWGSEEHDASQRAPLRLTTATYSKKGELGLHANEDRYAAFADLNAEINSKREQAAKRAGESNATGIPLDDSPKGSAPPDNAFFAVYDGHGGSTAAVHLANRVHLLLASDWQVWRNDPRQAMVNAFKLAEAELRQIYQSHPEDTSGSCAIVGLLRGHKLIVGWVGDCRGLLIRSEGHSESCKQLSRDHRASESKEHARVLHAGGQISDGRVWGALMPSRTLGDFPWKDRGPGLIAEPEILELEIGPSDKYIVFGSDGLFDVLPNKAVGKIASKMNSSAQKVCNELTKELRKKPTTDDTTIVVVQLGAGGPH